jgi:hypothetical protein
MFWKVRVNLASPNHRHHHHLQTVVGEALVSYPVKRLKENHEDILHNNLELFFYAA